MKLGQEPAAAAACAGLLTTLAAPAGAANAAADYPTKAKPDTLSIANAGQVDLMFQQTGEAPPSLQAGKIRALAVTIEHPSVKGRIIEQDNAFGGGSPKDFSDFIASENAKWSRLVKQRKITME